MTTPLTDRSASPTSTRSFEAFRRMTDRAMQAAKSAFSVATSRNRAQEANQSIDRLTATPQHTQPAFPERPDMHHGLLGGRGSGRGGNAAVDPLRAAQTGHEGRTSGQPWHQSRHVNPTPGQGGAVPMPKTLDGHQGPAFGPSPQLRPSDHHVINGKRPSPASRF
jgi:hypothetical protein